LLRVIPQFSDQPVFAEREARFSENQWRYRRRPRSHRSTRSPAFPVTWKPLAANQRNRRSAETGRFAVHASRPGNILIGGRVVCGDVDDALRTADVCVEAEI